MFKEYSVQGGGGLNLKVKQWGDQSGMPILFIHGWSQSHMCWSYQYLAEELQKYRLVAFDLRGHGSSDAPQGEHFYTDGRLWAEDVNTIITQLSMEEPVLVGWSFGGIVITDYLKSFGDGNISGVNFVGAAIQLNESAMGTLIGPGLLDHFEGATSEDKSIHTVAMKKFLKGCFSVPLSELDFKQALKWNLDVRPDVRLALTSRDIDASKTVNRIKVPILITQGTSDTIVLPAMAEAIMANAPKSSTSWFEGIGHAPFLEDSARFNKELEDFTVLCKGG